MNQVNNQATAPTEEVAEDKSITSPLEDQQGGNVNEEENKSIPHLVEDQADDEGDDELYERPDYFPQQFWDEKEGPDLEGLAKSYQESRKLISQGKHKAPENGEYETIILEEKGVALDDPLAQEYLGWAKENGISQAAFDDLAERFIGINQQKYEDQEQTLISMKEELGPDADNILKSNISWADGLVRKGILTESEREELDIMGGTPEAQRILVKLRQMQGDMSPIPTVSAPVGMESEEEFKQQMAEAMQDKRYGVDANYTRGVEKRYVERYNRS